LLHQRQRDASLRELFFAFPTISKVIAIQHAQPQ
jgi:hypothetical protein